ncbi:hypothetical protein [Spirosoma luteum]|uniref:hypothetical protein n=1 Tax=Spirosoma luteum TaxID=431553 RepID=UPI0003A1680E|nr:hypothetical protein [Spirosoma luteum]
MGVTNNENRRVSVARKVVVRSDRVYTSNNASETKKYPYGQWLRMGGDIALRYIYARRDGAKKY